MPGARAARTPRRKPAGNSDLSGKRRALLALWSQLSTRRTVLLSAEQHAGPLDAASAIHDHRDACGQDASLRLAARGARVAAGVMKQLDRRPGRRGIDCLQKRQTRQLRRATGFDRTTFSGAVARVKRQRSSCRLPLPLGPQPGGGGKRTCMWFSWFGYGTTTPLGPRRSVEYPTKTICAPAAMKRSRRSCVSSRSI